VRRIWRCFRDKSGSSYPLVIAMVLGSLLLLCGIQEFFRLQIIASGVKEALQDVIVVTVNDNYANVYHGVREGYSGGYRFDGDVFLEAVDPGDVYYELAQVLGISKEGERYVKYAGGVLEYQLSGLMVTVRNAPLAPKDPENAQRFEVDAAMILEVPVRFAGKVFPAMKTTLKVQAGYIEVF